MSSNSDFRPLTSEVRPLASARMDWPRITVVTPTFNRIEYLEECILSVLNQNYPNLEYIVCDGGSKNQAVLDLIQKYEGRISWWDSVQDRGHAEAIKRGFDRSTGEIMAYLCSDDVYLPGTIAAVAEAFRMRPEVDVVYGSSYVTDARGAIVREVRTVPPTRLGVITCLNLVQPATFWTRDIYRKAGGQIGGLNWEYAVFEPNVDLLYRMARDGLRCRQSRRFLTAMRQHEGAVSARFREETARVQRECLRRDFPFWSRPIVYRPLWWVMRARQLAWHVAQGELGYVWRRGRRPND